MYLRRKIDDYLTQWKNNENRYPLIIKGSKADRENRVCEAFCRPKL